MACIFGFLETFTGSLICVQLSPIFLFTGFLSTISYSSINYIHNYPWKVHSCHFLWHGDHLIDKNPTYCNMFMPAWDWRTEIECLKPSWTQILDIPSFQWAYITKSTCPRSSIPGLIFIFVCSDSCTLNFK